AGAGAHPLRADRMPISITPRSCPCASGRARRTGAAALREKVHRYDIEAWAKEQQRLFDALDQKRKDKSAA
ncbi:MAG: hypothetical protein AAFV96_06520, partial [Pseudomonadota bacterium]